MKCIFCEIVRGEIHAYKVWENDEFLVILDVNPINKGHLLLIPKNHIEDVFDMPSLLFSNIFLVAKKIAPILKQSMEAKKIGVAIEGFGVPHVHIHLVPLNKGNELNPERAKRATENSLQKLKNSLSEKFNNI
jgi:histidine triad (HIT) family protein